MFRTIRMTPAALGFVAIASVVLLTSASAQAPARPAAAQADTGVIATVRRLQHAYAEAVLRKDSVALRRIEAADAVIVGPDGSVGTGADDIRAVLSGEVVFDSLKVDSLVIRPVGPVVVVSALSISRARAGTTDISGTYRLLDVWARRGGQWQVVAEQITPVTRRQ